MQSVFVQTSNEYEYIIIDGGSTDGSKEYIDTYADKLSYHISEPDDGIYDAMNKGISQAKGECLMFLNSGDFLLNKDVLSSAGKTITQEPADVYYGDIEIERENGHIQIQKYPAKLSLQFLEKNMINHQASFIKTSLFKESGLYDARFELAADYAFFLKAFVTGKKFHYLNKELVHYKLDGLSVSKKQQYLSEVNEIWNLVVPGYLKEMYAEHNAHKSLMQHRIMLLAKKMNKRYTGIRKYLPKKNS